MCDVIYGPYLKDNFVEISEGEWWRNLVDSLLSEVIPLDVLNVEAVKEEEGCEAQDDFQDHFLPS